MIGLQSNPINLQYFNIADMKNEYIKLGQSINSKLKEVNRKKEDLFLKYKIGNHECFIQDLFLLANNKMIVFYNKLNEPDTPLHISEEVPFYHENFELKIEEIY